MNAPLHRWPRADDASAHVDSPAAWRRLAAAVVVATIGGVGMWSMPVVLPAVQADFGVARGDASLPFTMAMMGFAFGGVAMGRLTDRFGVGAPVLSGAMSLGVGYVAASLAPNLLGFALAYLLIGLGASAGFGPLMTDMSRWFQRWRGIAVAIVSSGNYVAGTIWPPFLQHAVATEGWRAAHVGVGAICVVTMLPLLLLLRQPAPAHEIGPAAIISSREATLGISSNAMMVLLSIAGLACCVAMAMPQVHIVAYCGDLGYGVARGAEMLALMLGFGIVSRIASGFIADRLGGAATLAIGSALQGLALLLYVFFDGLVSLYVISALFGLFQGGIIPMYAVLVRQYFAPQEVGVRLGIVLMATLFGMAFGGWMSGVIFDFTGSYRAAFVNGLAWNLLNLSIAIWLTLRPGGRFARA